MAVPYKFSLLSPRGKAIDGSVDAVVAPGLDGELGVLAHHAPLIAALRRGITKVTTGAETQFFVTGEGVLEVTLNDVHMLVDNAEKADTLDQARELMKAHLQETGDVKPAGKTS